MQLEEVEVMSHQHEAHILSVVVEFRFGHLLLQFAHLDARGNRTACVDGLCGLERKIVAKVRHIGLHAVGKIPVAHPAVADVAEGESGFYGRQAVVLGHFDGLYCLVDGQVVYFQAFAVRIGQAEEFFYSQHARLGRRRPESDAAQ